MIGFVLVVIVLIWIAGLALGNTASQQRQYVSETTNSITSTIGKALKNIETNWGK